MREAEDFLLGLEGENCRAIEPGSQGNRGVLKASAIAKDGYATDLLTIPWRPIFNSHAVDDVQGDLRIGWYQDLVPLRSSDLRYTLERQGYRNADNPEVNGTSAY